MLGEPSTPMIRLTWGAMRAVKGPSLELISRISSILLIKLGDCQLKTYQLAWGPARREPSQSKMQRMGPPSRRKGRLTRCLSALAAPWCRLSFPVLQNIPGLEFQRSYKAISDVTREYVALASEPWNSVTPDGWDCLGFWGPYARTVDRWMSVAGRH